MKCFLQIWLCPGKNRFFTEFYAAAQLFFIIRYPVCAFSNLIFFQICYFLPILYFINFISHIPRGHMWTLRFVLLIVFVTRKVNFMTKVGRDTCAVYITTGTRPKGCECGVASS